jgi:uncharacterized protein (DUF2345 family)
MSGADTQFVSGGQMRVHAKQAIGVLGGAVAAGEGGLGLQAIAAKNAVDVQAQSDTLAIQAHGDVKVISATSFSEWLAKKSISLSTTGGANITIDGGNITVQCPGKITIHAGTKSFQGPERKEVRMPYLPVSNLPAAFSQRLDAHDLFVWHDFNAISYAAKLPDGRVLKGVLDKHGRSPQIFAKSEDDVEILVGQSLDEWDLIADIDPNESDDIVNA